MESIQRWKILEITFTLSNISLEAEKNKTCNAEKF